MGLASAARDRALAEWLLGHGPPPSASTLRAARVAAYAYSVLPSRAPLRFELRPDFVAALGRHQRLKADFQPLVRAWREAGLDVLLFKGFHLSEFVYPRSGARFHGDIDVLLSPAQQARAEQIAIDLGWQSTRPYQSWFRRNHMAFVLARPDVGARIDVHTQLLHVMLPWHSAQRRITAAAWASSRSRLWDDVEIRELCPLDMLLIGVVLPRCWGAERWQVKPHDIIDFKYVSSRYCVTRAALWNRARELRCERTFGIFLERCDPAESRLDLAAPHPITRRRFDRLAFLERGLLGNAERNVARAIVAPHAVPVGLSFVALVLRVRQALRQRRDMRSLLASLAGTAADDGKRVQMSRELVIAGVLWALRLVGAGPAGLCLVRALAVFVALRQHGYPVEFVSGVRRGSGIVIGHAWVEVDGGTLLELGPQDVRSIYRENFRFPPRPTEPTDRSPAAISPAVDPTGAPGRVARPQPG
jgi:hypothetical protein